MRRSRSPIKIDQPNKVIQGDFKMQLMEVLTDWNTLRREAYESGSTIYWKIKRFCFLWDPKWKSLLKEKKKKNPRHVSSTPGLKLSWTYPTPSSILKTYLNPEAPPLQPKTELLWCFVSLVAASYFYGKVPQDNATFGSSSTYLTIHSSHRRVVAKILFCGGSLWRSQCMPNTKYTMCKIYKKKKIKN